MSRIIIKVSNDCDMIESILNCNVEDTFELPQLMHHSASIQIGDFVLLVLGGDHSRPDIEGLNYRNGLKAIAKVINGPYNLVDNHYSLDIEILFPFNNTITKNDFYLYPELKDIPNIGASTKGVKNQAVSLIDNNKFECILKAIIDLNNDISKDDIIEVIGNDFLNNNIQKYTNSEFIDIS